MSITRKKGPLYLQIKKIIKDRIMHGVYPLGTTIPSEPQLEKEFSVSKMTVRNAVQELAQEGYVEKRSGVGTTVIRNTSLSKLSKGKRFTELLVENGHQIRKQLLHTSWMNNEPDSPLYQHFGSRCLKVERLYWLDEQPYIHYVHYLASVFPQTLSLEGLSLQSLYDLIEEYGIELHNFRDSFTVSSANEDTAKLLQVKPQSVILERLRYSYDIDGNLVEYSQGFYNTGLQHYLVNYDV
ncbi:GntR family transcriptional regulator [Paenibacillus sp. WLX1005]|uniref:GntR family transcriptional regulator n=1 Tax=Paenibacillus sp. WLX1005 TaxID=3243766 RepID=UPI0039843060